MIQKSQNCVGSFVRDFDLDLKISSVSKNNFHISILQWMSIFDLEYSECHCFRLVTRMAEANVGPPESAPDESGSGEEQKEEKQDEEGEGDRAFEVEMSSHATNHWVSSHDMNILFFTGACSFLPSSSSRSSTLSEVSSSCDLYSVQHMPGHCERCSGVDVWSPFLLALLAPGVCQPIPMPMPASAHYSPSNVLLN